jgi:nucleotide-binding universal stress UspA family protein
MEADLVRILIAVDERGFADKVKECIDQYKLSGSDDYKVVHVIPRESGVAEYLIAHSDVVQSIHRDSMLVARGLVRKTALRLRDRFHNAHVSEQVCEGEPASTIIKIAKLWPADVIIVSSHGRSGVEKLLLGSVSSAIVANAPCTVLVLRSGLQEPGNQVLAGST